MKNWSLHIVLIIFSTLTAVGQPFSACFTTNKPKGCAPFKIQASDCSGQVPARRKYNFGTDNVKYSDSSYTYTQPGIYTVTQYVDDGFGSVSTTTQTIEIVPPTYKLSYELKVCAGGQAILTVTDNIDNQYVYDFGEAGKPGNTGFLAPFTPYTYTYSPGDNTPKNVRVMTFNLSCQTVDTTIIPITSLVQPDFRKVEVLSQSATGSISLTFNTSPGQRYFIQRSDNNNSTYSNIDTLYSPAASSQVLTYSGLNTATSQYCFRILSYDDCNPPVPSQDICSVINTVTAGNNQNNISWAPHLAGNVLSYDISKNNAFLISTTSNSYSDNAVNCGGNYCYTLTGQLTGGLTTVSAAQCVTAVSTNIPPAVANLKSSVAGNTVAVTWDKPVAAVTKYNVYRSQNGSSYSLLTSTTTNAYTDGSVSVPGNTYCYQVDYTDSCNNSAPVSVTSCPLILEVTTDPVNTGQNNLSWTSYSGSWNPTSYIIEKLDANGTVLSSSIVGIAFAEVDIVPVSSAQTVRYRIKAVSSTGEYSYSNIAEIKYEGAVYLPNAFTPNGDHNNDTFTAKGKFIKDFRLTVFNRWGEVVYFTEDMNEGWDGFYQNTLAAPDAYAYLVEATDIWDKKITRRGSVTLLR